MTKAGADNWKTPLGYYERAIAELTKTREEIQAELQNLKKMQTDLVGLQNLKAEFQSSQIELQAIKAELQTTKECLATTQQTASEAQARVATVEKSAHDAHTELQELKHFMTNQLPANNTQVIKELSQLKEQLSQVQFQLQQIEPQISLSDNFKTQTLKYLSDLHSQVSKLASERAFISSASGTDYTQLRDLLAAGEWKKADRETHLLICRMSNRDREGWGWLDRGEIERFPWQDFRIINRLWVEYSQGRFGFSVQKQIWQSIEVANNDKFEVEKTLGDRVEWRVNNNWLNYEQFTFTLNAAEGHLPSTLHLLGVHKGRVEDRIRFLFSRPDL